MTLQRDHSGRFYHDTPYDLKAARITAEQHINHGYCANPSMMRYFYNHDKGVFNEYMETYLVKFWSDTSHV